MNSISCIVFPNLCTYKWYSMSRVQYLLKITLPYQIVFCICGVAPFPVTSRGKSLNRILAILLHIYKTCLIVGTSFITYKRCAFALNRSYTSNDYLWNGLQFVQFITLTMVQLMMHFIVFLKYNRLRNIFFKIISIDDSLVEITNELHMFQLRSTFKRHLIVVSSLMLVTIILQPITTMNWYYVNHISPLQWTISVISEITIRLKSMEFCVLIQVFNELLCEILNNMNELLRSFNSCVGHGKKHSVDRLLLQGKMAYIQNLQSEMWKTLNLFTDYFSITIVSQFIYNGLTITNIIYWIYMKFSVDSHTMNVSRIFTLAFLLLDMLIPCYLSDECIQTYGKIIRLVHGLKPKDTDLPMKLRLREYSLQLAHQKLVLSCGGYFDINLQCFGEIILSITTYIVILIQFKLQADKI